MDEDSDAIENRDSFVDTRELFWFDFCVYLLVLVARFCFDFEAGSVFLLG
jgi:hypothetical protein